MVEMMAAGLVVWKVERWAALMDEQRAEKMVALMVVKKVV